MGNVFRPIQSKTLKRSLLVLLAVIFLFGVGCLFHPFRREVRITVQIAIAHAHKTPTAPFPAIDPGKLTPTQRRIVSLAKQEYTKKPVSYNNVVLTYTQGVSEPWCADFASWIYMQAGHPFSNPNSGSWRIPGVYTLQDYFTTHHQYVSAGKYVPKTGDVAIYHAGEGHTTIVLSVHDGQMTTIGGNEGGHMVIDTRPYTKGSEGLNGFGVL